MLTIKKILFLAAFFILCSNASGQYNGYNFSLNLNYNYTASSKLYLQPKSSDDFLRGIHSFLDKISGYGIELRARITDNFAVGLGADYIRRKGKVSTISVISEGVENITVDDGYQVIPLELTGYYIFPFSLKNLKIFMGGGIGFYFGSHVREIGDIEAKTYSRETAYGIHVLVGADLMLTDYISIRGGVKFRDVEFSMSNTYNKLDGNYNGVPVMIINPRFDSKVAIDGILLNIGLTFHF